MMGQKEPSLMSYRTIDWDTASFVPAPAAVQHPVFMADIPGYRLGDVPEGMEFADDRGYLESAMRKVSPDAGDVADLLATSFERQFLELSLRNKKINEQYVRLRLGDAEIDKAALNAHLDQFLLTNMGMEAHPTILDMREQLAVHERA